MDYMDKEISEARREQQTWLIFIMSVILIAILAVYKKESSYQLVRPAILFPDAEKMVTNLDCYIVKIRDYDPENKVLSRFYYEDGEEQIPLLLLGRNPSYELSYIFFKPNQNRFLVCGHIDNGLTEYYGQKVLIVNEWYLIKPVKRQYGSGSNIDLPRENRRFFYSKDGLDRLDAEWEDYVCLEQEGDIFMRYPIMEYYLRQKGYYLIMPYNGEWYQIQYDPALYETKLVRRVTISGNHPEYAIHESILNNDRKYTNNFFLVKGEASDNWDSSTNININKWWLHHPFNYSIDSPVIGDSKWGFTSKDIERGIFKIYH